MLLSESKLFDIVKAIGLAAGIAAGSADAQTNITQFELDQAASKVLRFFDSQNISADYSNAQQVEDAREFALIAIASQEAAQNTEDVSIGGAVMRQYQLRMMYDIAARKLKKNYHVENPEELLGAIQDVIYDK